MHTSPFQSFMSRVGVLFARPRDAVARACIDPASVAVELRPDTAEPALTIAVRIVNARSEIGACKEPVHE